MANQERLNNDVIERILLRVPPSSLIRYQLVCKTWRDIIQEARFKKEHFERNNTTNEPLRLLVVKMGVHMLQKGMVVDVGWKPIYDIWMPRDLGSDGHFGGSCNGLICIQVKGEITVFNPITRQVRSLPKPTHIMGYGSNKYESMKTESFSHSTTGEYKVMIFYQKDRTMPFCCVTVNMYTLGANSNNSWRTVDVLRRFPVNHGVNVEDTIYWPCLSEAHCTDIISMDLSREKIKYISSPRKDAMLTGLTKWHDGKLCGLSFQQEHSTMNLWTLDSNSAGSGRIYTAVRYWYQLEGHVSVRLLAPYNSIKENTVYFVSSNNALLRRDFSGSISSGTAVRYTDDGGTWEIMNCFAYVETLLSVPA